MNRIRTAILAATAAAAMSGPGGPGSLAAAAQSACPPYGNPPRRLEPLATGLLPVACRDGRELDAWKDADGTARHACLYQPAAASPGHPLPLVIYLHPSVLGADITLTASHLRAQVETADLTGDPARPGFLLLAPAGRVTTRFYPFPDAGGTPGWDNWYRQLAPAGAYPENVDAATIDHYLSEVLATGVVDEKRIYLMGWSNGAAVAVLYSLNRPQIAAAAVYSAPDPLAAFNDPCPQTPVPAAPRAGSELEIPHREVPVYHVHNNCDIAGLCPNALRMADRLWEAGVLLAGQIIDGGTGPAGRPGVPADVRHRPGRRVCQYPHPRRLPV
jgi:dienelactone hydrolase